MNGFSRWVRRTLYGPATKGIGSTPPVVSAQPPTAPAPHTRLADLRAGDLRLVEEAVARARAATPQPPQSGDPDVTDQPRALDPEPAPEPAPEQVDVPLGPPRPDDSGVHLLDDTGDDFPVIAATCHHCEGRGHVERTVSDLLRESIALIPPDGGDAVVKEFYTRLLTVAPHLAPLFPHDLLSAAIDDEDSRGATQRDRLLRAIVDLSELYGTGAANMQRLDTHLATFGRAHAAFARPDGSVRGATLDEYLVVRDVFLATCRGLLGNAWRPEYDQAWTECLNDATVAMLYAQQRSGMRMARYPRQGQGR